MSKSTLFQQTVDLFECLVPLCEELLQSTETEIPNKIEIYQQLDRGVRQLEPTIGKLRQRAGEKDPDKQTYGPAMLKKINDLIDKFDRLQEVYEEELKPTFDQLLKQKIKKEKEQEASVRGREEAEKAASVEQGREETRKEEERRRRQQLENEEKRKQKEDEEEQLKIEAKKAEVEAEQRRRELLLEVENAEKELELDGSELHCLKGLKRLAATYSMNREFRYALEPIIELLTSIYREPDLPFLRVIRLLNEQFAESVGAKPGSTSILLSTGFKLKNQIEATSMIQRARQSLEDRQPSLLPPASNYSNNELYWVLAEPDSVLEHNKWKDWIQRVEKIRFILISIRNELRTDLSLSPDTAVQQYQQHR